MALLFLSTSDDPKAWRAALIKRLPDVDLRVWPETGDASQIDAALVWNHPPGELLTSPNRRAIMSLGAGVNQILDDPKLPPGVPIARIVDPGLTAGMVEYALLAVLRYHRNFDAYESFQREKHWSPLPIPVTERRRIGVLGLGAIGGARAPAIPGPRFSAARGGRARESAPGVAHPARGPQAPAVLGPTRTSF